MYIKINRQKKLVKALSENGILPVMTGGGPGIMESSQQRSLSYNGYSIVVNIYFLPQRTRTKSYLHKWINIPYFFVPKFLLLKYSFAFVVLPGGIGNV